MKKKIEYNEHNTEVFTSAATECTGLVYPAPVAEFEMESYADACKFRPHTIEPPDK